MTLEQLQIILFDLYDLRNALSNQTKKECMESEITIGKHMDEIIEMLEAIETEECEA